MRTSSLSAWVVLALFAIELSVAGACAASGGEASGLAVAPDVTVRRGGAPPDVDRLEGVARLELRGGEGFGGLSALLWGPGDRLFMASDRGRLASATPTWGVGGRLLELSDWRWHELPLPAGWSRDIEGLAVSTGNLLVSVEEPPHVIRFAGPADQPRQVTSYLTWEDLGFERNRGFEALTDLSGDGWLALAETAGFEGHVAVTRDGRRYRYRAASGFAPTAADRAGTRIMVLERRLSLLGGWQARLACFSTAALDQSPVLEPAVIARLDGGDGIDNMEGLALRPRGRDLDLFIVSDDNENALQRTVLLQYRWPDAASGGCGP